MGQGTKTIFPQLVAAELGVDVDDVEMAPQDTAFVPDSGPTVASRTAMVVGGLLIEAARRLKAEVEGRTGRPFGAVVAGRRPRRTATTRIDERFTPYAGRHLRRRDLQRRRVPDFGWAAAVAEVEVDLDTAEVAVLSVVAVDDVGRVIHPVLCEGQVEGGTLQAVGYATIEEIKLARRPLPQRPAGRRTSSRPRSTRPRIDTILVEAPFADAPHGAKGVGELPMDVGAPAVVAAIHDATGAWIHDLPATPERILAALAGIEPPGAPGVSAVSGARRPRDLPAIVNGEPVEVGVPGMRRLLDVLREDLGLTGTKEGCGEGECGACTVLVDGEAVVSCLVPVCQVDGIGRAHRRGTRRPAGGGLGDLQDAFLVAGRRAVRDLHARDADGRARRSSPAGAEPTDGAIREAIAGNLCRCTGYTKIIDSIQLAAVRRRAGAGCGAGDARRAAGRLALARCAEAYAHPRRRRRTGRSPAARTCSSSSPARSARRPSASSTCGASTSCAASAVRGERAGARRAHDLHADPPARRLPRARCRRSSPPPRRSAPRRSRTAARSAAT